MSGAQAERVIRNIIREIALQCASRGHSVTDTLVAFMVKAVVLDPKNLFNVDRTLTKQDVQKLIELCVEKLLDHKSPALDTIKMQVYFDLNYTSRREFIEEHHKVFEGRLLAASREITDCRARSRDELDALYRSIVAYVLLRSGLGPATDINAVRETAAALQSVFPQSELPSFMSLLKRDKEQQLKELTLIVTGIRLFNKDGGKGGESVPDLPAVLNDAVPAVSRELERELEEAQRVCWCYTALLEGHSDPKIQRLVSTVLLKQALYNSRQHEAFLKIILVDLILCAKKVETLQTELAERVQILKVTVQDKTAVPTSQVFPHFTAMAKLWAELQEEELIVSMLSSMVSNLRPFLSAQAQLLKPGQLGQLLEGVRVKSDQQRMDDSSGERVDPVQVGSGEWLFPENTANFDKLPLQYRGVCGYTLVQEDGLLLPGNPSIGVLKYKDRLYLFSSRHAACEFADRPDEFIERVAECVSRSPELIQLLQLHQQFSFVSPYTQMESGEKLLVKAITKCHSSTQTDTHLLERNIVRSYEWNEWELRRKAIKQANLRSKVTRSVQTHLSHRRRENCTQTFPPRDAGGQTMKDDWSNVPKPQIYLAGLRGGDSSTTHMSRVNITRDVDE